MPWRLGNREQGGNGFNRRDRGNSNSAGVGNCGTASGLWTGERGITGGGFPTTGQLQIVIFFPGIMPAPLVVTGGSSAMIRRGGKQATMTTIICGRSGTPAKIVS